MIEVNGKFNSAKIYTDIVDSKAISQVIELCNQESITPTRKGIGVIDTKW